jgi:hypothetical protein
MKRTIAIALSLAFMFNASTLPGRTCAFGSDPYWTYTLHPDFPMGNYASGQLGILKNTYARSYLMVAYRYLTNKPLAADEKEGFQHVWDQRLQATYSDCAGNTESWLKLRATVPGVSKIETIDTERPVSKENSYESYCNAQTSAFETAAKTLKSMIEKYGIGSTQVKDWVQAQDEVFANCGSPRYSDKVPEAKIPTPLPDSADTNCKQERAYQIAAANFYAQNFEAARREFEAIAADTNSRWKEMAGYLATRSMIRQATLAKEMNRNLLEQAGQKIQQLIANPSYATLKDDLQSLANFVSVRVSPDAHLNRLTGEKFDQDTIEEITKTIDNYLDPDNSATEVTYSKVPDNLKKNEMIDWILTFQATDEASTKHALARWKETKSTAWLVAAITGVDAEDQHANQLVTAARADKSACAKWTLFYHINRIESGQGKDAAVKASLDKVLAAPPADLPAGSLNALKLMRLPLSANLDEFLRFGIQTPLAICSDGGVPEMPDEEDDLKGKGKTPPAFTTLAGNVLTTKFPLSVLRQVATNKQVPVNLRNNVAWTSWVRAILIGDEAEAKNLAVITSPLNKAKSKFFASYLAATTPEERKFAAALLMLHFSSAEPNATSGQLQDDDYGDASGWWWGANPVHKFTPSSSDDDSDSSSDDEPFDPMFLTAAQKAQAASQLAKLAKVETAPNYLAKIVLAYAQKHPADPRVPEALHYGVKCTRYGATDDATTKLSKQMFLTLHSKYKGNVWTKQTPYWY